MCAVRRALWGGGLFQLQRPDTGKVPAGLVPLGIPLRRAAKVQGGEPVPENVGGGREAPDAGFKAMAGWQIA